MRQHEEIAEALDRNFTSPACCDSNLADANVVDGLYVIAKGIRFLAKATLVAAGKTMKDYDAAMGDDG